jgi:hypothetical protein
LGGVEHHVHDPVDLTIRRTVKAITAKIAALTGEIHRMIRARLSRILPETEEKAGLMTRHKNRDGG